MLYLRILVICAVGAEGRGKTFCREIWVGPFRSTKARRRFKKKWDKLLFPHLQFESLDPSSLEVKRGPPDEVKLVGPTAFKTPKMKFETHKELHAWVGV